MITLIIALFISTFALIILFQIKTISKRYGFYDNPAKGQNKIHKYPISNMGGLACLIPILISIVITFFIDTSFSKKFLLIIFISSIGFYSLGRLDDIKNLSPNKKILFFCLIFLFFFPLEENLIIKELRFKYIGLYLDLGDYSIFFTLFCIFLFYNASNFIDGINGLYGTTIVFWLFVLIFITGNSPLIITTTIFSLLYFLIFNFKNMVFIGNSGNSFITCLVASFYIFFYNSFENIYCDEIFLAFFIPGLDTVRLSIERLIKKRSPFSGDNQHLHHLILKKTKIITAYTIEVSLIITPFILLLFTKNFYYSLIIPFLIYLIMLASLKNFKKK